MNKFKVFLLVMALLPMAFSQRAHAAYTGSRSTTGGDLIADSGWSVANGGFLVSFSVEQQANGVWHYDYSFTNANGLPLSPGITGDGRFFKLQVSDNAVNSNPSYGYLSASGTVSLPPTENDAWHLWNMAAGTPFYPGNGEDFIKYQVASGTTNELADGQITIVSSQAPMWGSFYIRGEAFNNDSSEVVNRGFNGGVFPMPTDTESLFASVGGAPLFDLDALNHMNDAAYRYWIPVPDSNTSVVPIPSALVLLGSGFLGLMGVGRLQKKRRS